MTSGLALICELASSLVSGAFDPDSIRFTPADEKGIGPVRAGCGKPPGTLHRFGQQLNRNAFLLGCHTFTADAPVEHLIVGFGFRWGSTTTVCHMTHVVGSEAAVSIPGHIAAAVRSHLKQEHANGVLVFHNHPRNVVNAVLDNTPLPSGADRQALLAFHRDTAVMGKTLMGNGRARFYLGENGFVQEFRTPDLLALFAG